MKILKSLLWKGNMLKTPPSISNLIKVLAVLLMRKLFLSNFHNHNHCTCANMWKLFPSNLHDYDHCIRAGTLNLVE